MIDQVAIHGNSGATPQIQNETVGAGSIIQPIEIRYALSAPLLHVAGGNLVIAGAYEIGFDHRNRDDTSPFTR